MMTRPLPRTAQRETGFPLPLRIPFSLVRAWPVMLTLLLAGLALAPRAARAADAAACDPQAMLDRAAQDPALADKLMAYTVESLVARLRCAVSTRVMDQIRKDPADAELLLSEHDPDCYEKMRTAYTSATRDDLDNMIGAVTEALERLLIDQGCPRDHEAAAALVSRDYLRRALEMNYMGCVNALRSVASAETMYHSENDAYTDDMGDLAQWLAPSDDRTARGAEAVVAASCCAAAGCAAGDPALAWDASWGIELEDDTYALYGYPITRPDCLILVTPDAVDPETIDQCLAESETEDDE